MHKGVLLPMPRKGKPRYADWLHEGFPLWLQMRLQERDWSITDLARAMGVQTSLISRWMAGRQKPTAESANRIAEVLQISVDEVLTEAGLRPVLVTDEDPRRAELVMKLGLVELTTERYLTLNALLSLMLNANRSPSA
jgi:transcriptional regulator with XRE-family HTH domain